MFRRLTITIYFPLLACATGATETQAPLSWSGSANAGEIGASLYLVEERDRFLADWNKTGDQARFDMTTSVKIGKSVEAVIIFWGCQPDPGGDCSLYSEISVFVEDGAPPLRRIAHASLGRETSSPSRNALARSDRNDNCAFWEPADLRVQATRHRPRVWRGGCSLGSTTS